MDQKHAMLYPPIDEGGVNAMPHDQRVSASTSIGLPIEAPPSYDAAMSGGDTATTTSSASAAVAPSMPVANPGWVGPVTPNISPAIIVVQPKSAVKHGRRHRKHEAVTVGTIQMPTQWQQQQEQQQQTQQTPYQTPSHQLPTVSPTTSQRPKLGPNPCAVTCSVCGSCETSRLIYTPSTRTHVSALVFGILGFCCCACFVPYCMDSCRTGNHYCGKCNTFLGTYNPRHANK